jgi:hypothetical protein
MVYTFKVSTVKGINWLCGTEERLIQHIQECKRAGLMCYMGDVDGVANHVLVHKYTHIIWEMYRGATVEQAQQSWELCRK